MAALAIEMKPVQSSRLAALGYDPENFQLFVRFPPTKTAPAGKVYRYENVSEETFDDLCGAASIGQFFNEVIVKNADKYPYLCVDDGSASAAPYDTLEMGSTPVTIDAPAPAEIIPAEIPDDPDGLKTRALATRTEATAITITTADECESASHAVLRIRAERKVVVEKINKIKEPATAAWKAACALFNEVDGRYAEAERFLDDGILAYRAEARRKAAQEQAAREKAERDARESAEREQREEYERRVKAANDEAAQKAAELSKQDAKDAEAQGAPPEVIEQILANPLPVTVQHVVPPPLAYAPAPLASIVTSHIPKVSGLSYTTEYFYTITDESMIPFTHEFYTLDPKKIDAKVQSLKKHANIPGVYVDSREVPRKNTGRAR
jgi:hypothetical protein